MAKYGVQLRDANGDSLYPRTIIEQIYNMAGSARLDVLLSTMRENLEGDIADTNLAVARLREDLNALLSNATLSGAILDAIIEIKTLLDSNSSDVVEQLVTTMSALRDEAIRNVAQELTLSQKQQARTNVGAVGVKYTDNRGAHLEQAGTEIMPYTKAEYVAYRGSNLDAVVNVLDERSRETKEKVDTFLADADTSEQALDKLKELQDYIKNDETSASQMLGDIAQNKQDIADNAEAIEKEATRAKQTEMYLESQKANKSGYYENLSVGVADNLSGRGEATESEFSFRPSGGENKSIPEDGTARINTIKGNSVVWNQLSVISSKKFTIKNDTDNIIGHWLHGLPVLNGCEGHKLYIVATNDSDVYCYINLLKTYDINTGAICEYNNTIGATPALYCETPPNTNKEITVTLKITDLTKMFNGVNVPTTVEEFEALYGNMPNEYNAGEIIDNHTTAIKSVGVNAWDGVWEDGLIDSNGVPNPTVNGKRSKNFIKVISGLSYRTDYKGDKIAPTHLALYRHDKSFIGWIYNLNRLENATIPSDCEFVKITFGDNAYPFTGIPEVSFHLVHTGYMNGKYFPYESQIRQLPTVEGGLKSAGNIYDEIRYNKGKDKWEHVQRVGSVDLGTLSWSAYISTNAFWSNEVVGCVVAEYLSLPNFTSIFKNGSQSGINNGAANGIGENLIGVHNVRARIMFYSPSFEATDEGAALLKQSLQGVILNYELATPIVTELDVDISPDYKVWDYGTEEAISEVLSTPVRINANYGFNAVGQITDNTVLIQELLARVAVLEARVAQANSANVEPIVE